MNNLLPAILLCATVTGGRRTDNNTSGVHFPFARLPTDDYMLLSTVLELERIRRRCFSCLLCGMFLHATRLVLLALRLLRWFYAHSSAIHTDKASQRSHIS